jgi:IS5 family transposase
MTEKKPMVIYAAAYENTSDAMADLDAIEQLHKDKLIGSKKPSTRRSPVPRRWSSAPWTPRPTRLRVNCRKRSRASNLRHRYGTTVPRRATPSGAA